MVLCCGGRHCGRVYEEVIRVAIIMSSCDDGLVKGDMCVIGMLWFLVHLHWGKCVVEEMCGRVCGCGWEWVARWKRPF
ncbi:hypothetical protein BC829DRAFT_406633 [Chytridium lagenaria]|nr:hypothetical protein BC829DRAFT_406633 [Chytridium lagenaria]